MRLCGHYLQHQSSAWQRRVRQEERGGGGVPMPGQGRLAISRLRVPNLNSSVITTAGNLLCIGAPRHFSDTVIVISQHMNQQEQTEQNSGKHLPLRVPGQRRLAISRSRVPNLDGFVLAAAGNLLSIGTPHHRVDPEIVRSQDTNQQKPRGENLRKEELGKTNVPVRVPGHRPLEHVRFIFPSIFNLSASVDSCPDFLQFHAPVCGVEPRWKTNCQR